VIVDLAARTQGSLFSVLLSDCTEQSLPSEADSRSHDLETSRILCSSKVHYCVHHSSPVDSVLSEIDEFNPHAPPLIILLKFPLCVYSFIC
jgi:hypothetical protein